MDEQNVAIECRAAMWCQPELRRDHTQTNSGVVSQKYFLGKANNNIGVISKDIEICWGWWTRLVFSSAADCWVWKDVIIS